MVCVVIQLATNRSRRVSIILTLIQACRQDIAAGGDKNQKEGPKTRRGGAHFNNTVLDVCSNQGAKREMEGYIFQMGGPDTTAPPRWPRPSFDGSSVEVPLFSSRKISLFWKVFGWLRIICILTKACNFVSWHIHGLKMLIFFQNKIRLTILTQMTKDERLNLRTSYLSHSVKSNKCSILHFRLGLYWTLNHVSLSGQSVNSC